MLVLHIMVVWVGLAVRSRRWGSLLTLNGFHTVALQLALIMASSSGGGALAGSVNGNAGEDEGHHEEDAVTC